MEEIYWQVKMMEIYDLKCNYLKNPIGVETRNPLFSWMLQSNERGQAQTAYRIIAASSQELLSAGMYDLWDSGKVESDRSIHVPYGGKALNSREKAFWKVCVWDSSNNKSDWSEAAAFEMGLLDKEDWSAKWIGNPKGGTEITKAVPAPLFRKTIQLKDKVFSARVYVCGLGYYELYINGRKIGEEVLSQAFTRYDETILYNTYDVTDAFHSGENVFGVILGNGWYNCFEADVWNFNKASWRDQPKMLLQAHVTLMDGEELIIASDTSWRVSDSPIVFDGLRNGEFYDARQEKVGWNKPDYDDSNWLKANIVRSPGGVLKSFQMTPIMITGTIKSIELKEVEPSVWVYNLGQNISGWAQIKVNGSPGTEITLKYSEKIREDGSIDTSNIDQYVASGEFQTDKYILKGGGLEVWEPRFTYHGFQYIQVTGIPGTPSLDNLSGRVVHTAFESYGGFECSNDLLNSIQRCARWSTLTNYHGIPTDCPHREKNGWTGDAHLSAEQMLYNFNPMTAYIKWLRDFKDVQRQSGQLPGIVPTSGWGFNWGSGPAWDSAIVLIPWYLYLYCGDTAILDEMYCAMRKYLDYMSSMAMDYVIDFGLGDWCFPNLEEERIPLPKCPSAVTDTAYYYINASTMRKIALILGYYKDSGKYKSLAENIRSAFRECFLDTERGQVEGNCQTSMACALYQGLLDDDEQARVLQTLISEIERSDKHIDCGILGTKYIMHTLAVLGRVDIAYAMVTQTTFPGWGYWINQGATTLWESWSGDSSLNHHFFSDISAWFYKELAGINPDPAEPGFKHIIFHPRPVPGLYWVNASHQSMYGRVECNWKVENEKFKIKIIVPVNCHATLHVPEGYMGAVMEGGKPLDGISMGKKKDGLVLLDFGSGEYQFEVKKNRLFREYARKAVE